MPLPDLFCWTRFGTEAGQSASDILCRKEEERLANSGLFFWGIGNAIGPSMTELVRRTERPEVIFSPIRSAPRRQDVTPTNVAAWTTAETLDGDCYELPSRSLITSRFDVSSPRGVHYALVCYRESALTCNTASGELRIGELRNLLTGRPIGASQVTAVVTRNPGESVSGTVYNISFRGRLVAPYFLRLRGPLPLATYATGPKRWPDFVHHRWRESF